MKKKYSIWCVGCKFKVREVCDGVDACLIRGINQERKRIGSKPLNKIRSWI